MINLMFITSSRKLIRFEINGRIIKYFDDIWKTGVQLMPKDQNIIEKFRRSGQPSLKVMAALIIDANSGSNLREYESCKNEEDLANMVRRDCANKGLMEAK